MGRLILRRILGTAFLFVGVAGLFLPLTPGVLFIVIGMELVGLGFLIPERYRARFQAFRDDAWARVKAFFARTRRRK